METLSKRGNRKEGANLETESKEGMEDLRSAEASPERTRGLRSLPQFSGEGKNTHTCSLWSSIPSEISGRAYTENQTPGLSWIWAYLHPDMPEGPMLHFDVWFRSFLFESCRIHPESIHSSRRMDYSYYLHLAAGSAPIPTLTLRLSVTLQEHVCWGACPVLTICEMIMCFAFTSP